MAFAELERHADTPLKRYSSGMQSRLSFAIGMRFPADIYIFDEVLAVVDGAFRDRCLDEIQRLVGSGPTVLFVSHDLDQVSRLCERTIWLDRGTVRATGPTVEVLDKYRTAGLVADHEHRGLQRAAVFMHPREPALGQPSSSRATASR